MRQELSLGNGFYESESPIVANMVCQNLVPNYPQNQTISNSQVFGSAGIELLVSTGQADSNRGSILLGDVPFFVNGNFLYSVRRVVDINGTVTYSTQNEGSIIGTSRVSLAENGTQICIVVPSTGVGYIYTESGGLVQITDPNFTANGNAEVVVFIDGYFAFTTNSKKWFVSNLNDGTSYNALDNGTAEADPDNIRSAFVYRNQIYIFGSETVEVFNNVGGTGFPFQRVNGFVIPKGIAGKFCITAFDGTFAWLGQGKNESPRVFIFSGNDGVPISNNAIEFNIDKQSTNSIENCFSMTYTKRGRSYLSFTFDNKCFVYESKSSRAAGFPVWHTRTSQIETQKRWRVNSIEKAYGFTLVGDSVTGNIGILDDDNYSEYGQNIHRALSFPPIENMGKYVFYNNFEVIAFGGSDSHISLCYSDDSIKFNQKRYRNIGNTGEFNRTVRYSQLGASYKYRTFKLETTAKVKVQWNKCFLEVEYAS